VTFHVSGNDAIIWPKVEKLAQNNSSHTDIT